MAAAPPLIILLPALLSLLAVGASAWGDVPAAAGGSVPLCAVEASPPARYAVVEPEGKMKSFFGPPQVPSCGTKASMGLLHAYGAPEPPGGYAAQLSALLAAPWCAKGRKVWDRGTPDATWAASPLALAPDGRGAGFSLARTPAGGGGASFTVTLETPYELLGCNATDRFDGTYSVLCVAAGPHPLSGLEAKLTVMQQFDDFAGLYPQWRQPLNRPLMANCSIRLPGVPPAKAPRTPPPCTGGAVVAGGGQWVRDGRGGPMRYTYPGCTLQPFDEARMSRCLESRSMHFVGSSHARFTYDAAMDLLGKRVGLKLVTHHADHRLSPRLGYSRALFASKSPTKGYDTKEFRTLQKSIPKRLAPGEVFVFEVGAWDAQQNTVHSFLNGMVDVIRRLEALAATASGGGGVVMHGTAPFPNSHKTVHRGYRTNESIRAAEEMMLPRLRAAGVRVVNFGHIARARLEDVVCTDHYLCIDKTDGPITGEVGWWNAHAVYTVVCDGAA